MPNVNNITGINLEMIWPVGSYYWTSENINPNDLFGGRWEQVKDRFILAAGDKHKINENGGIEGYELQAEHMVGSFVCTYQNKTGQIQNLGGLKWEQNNVGPNEWFITEKSSGGILGYDVKYTALNNMPPYQVAYCWHRIA